MNKVIFVFLAAVIIIACNNNGMTSVEKADSTNKARLDSGLETNSLVVDENSSEFIVRAHAMELALYKISDHSRQKSGSQALRDFAGMICERHKPIMDSINLLAITKNIVLPESSSDGNTQSQILEAKGKSLDQLYFEYVQQTLKAQIKLYDNAILDAKDPAIRSFSDRTIIELRKQLSLAEKLDL